MVKLPYSAVYIINQVKLRRLILGISARSLAKKLGLVPQYISKIENMDQDYQYPLEMLSKIAKILGCDVREFYPPDELLMKNDGSNIFKKIINLSDIEVASKVINGMIETGYFKKAKSLTKIAKHLQVYGRSEAPVIEQVVNNFATNGKLTLKNRSYFQP